MSANRKKGILILGIGVLIMLISFLLPVGNGTVKENNRIPRQEYGGGDTSVSLIAISEHGETEVEYNISERQYTEAEIEEMLPDFLEELELAVGGQTEEQDGIVGDLNFAEEIEGYPFYITWSSDRRDLIGSAGNIKEEIPEDTLVILTAELEYDEWTYEHSFPVMLRPRKYTAVEEWLRNLESSLAGADEESKNLQYMALPTSVNGKTVEWKEKKENKGVQIGGFCVVVAFLFFCSDTVEKREQEKRRIEQIKKTYPEFILKCAMLIGAGMTIRQTFQRLGRSYNSNSKLKNPLYEEVLIGVRELENGVSERQVYEGFGHRCGIRETEKLGSMLSGNLRKGSEGLKCALRETAKEAMEMQKEQIRKKGEMAGTKLLFPMLILLLIVMVIIMIPAFSTFSI